MRKLALFAALCLVLTGCAGPSGQMSDTENGTSESSAAESAAEEESAAESAAAEASATEKLAESGEAGGNTEAPAAESGNTEGSAGGNSQAQDTAAETMNTEAPAAEATDTEDADAGIPDTEGSADTEFLDVEEVDTESPAVEVVESGGAAAESTESDTPIAETETVSGETEFSGTELPDIEVVDTVLTVYAPDDMAESFVTTEVEIAALNEETVVEQLIEAGVLPEGTEINSFAQSADKTQLTADFNSAFRDHLNSMGTAGEYVILGSVVNTFLTAYDADSILITVDQESLETGHNIYDQPLNFYE